MCGAVIVVVGRAWSLTLNIQCYEQAEERGATYSERQDPHGVHMQRCADHGMSF